MDKLKWIRMKCGTCGRFISKKDAEETSGRVSDAYRGRCVCTKCLNVAEDCLQDN